MHRDSSKYQNYTTLQKHEHSSPPVLYPPPLPANVLLLEVSQRRVRNRRERRREEESHVASEALGRRGTNHAPNHADVPELSHAEHGADDADRDRTTGGVANGKKVRRVVRVEVVVGPFATSEDEVLLDQDHTVDRKLAGSQYTVQEEGGTHPVGENDEEGVKDRSKVVRADDSEDDVDRSAQDDEEHARDGLGELAESLKR